MDEGGERKKVKNPRKGANILSVFLFTWILPTLWTGFRRDLEESDLYSPLDEHKSEILGEKIASAWQHELDRSSRVQKQKMKRKTKTEKDKTVNPEPSLLRVVMKCFGGRILAYGFPLFVMELGVRTAQPLFLGTLLSYYNSENTSVTKSEAYIYSAGVILCSAINVFVINPYMVAIMHMGMKVRVACCSLIYRKVLRLSKTALGQTTIGQAVNLLSNDVNRFDEAMIFLHYIWIAPLESVLVSYFLYLEVGIAGVIGVASLFLFIPLQVFLGKKSSTYRLRVALRTDERVRLTNEIMNGIQAIKMYTWEKPFSALVEVARKHEIDAIKFASYVRAIVMSFMLFISRWSLFVTVLAYVLLGYNITTEKVFVITAFFNILRENMTIFFPRGIQQVAEAMVSVKRLQKFMLSEESESLRDEYVHESKNFANGTDVKESVVVEGSAKWIKDEKVDTLRDISFKIRPGELIAVIGTVGSGKSSVLHAILRELPLHTGIVKVNGTVSYASQDPWLFAGSVRQNILFGREMNQQLYDRVISVCQLKRDFTLLPYADRTIVGDRGVSLSGGQRARINLARAVYANADIYLLDDPLSAVDAHVSNNMFKECIAEYLRGKTRILVTHQLQYLEKVDRIVILEGGSIVAQGSFAELQADGTDFALLLDKSLQSERKRSSATSRKSGSISTQDIFTNQPMTDEEFPIQEGDPEKEEELQGSGSVGGRVYGAYLRAGGNWCVISGLLVLFLLSQVFASASDIFISLWVNWEESYVTVVDGITVTEWGDGLSREACIYIFAGLMFLIIVVTLIRSFCFFLFCMRASNRLHDNMFRCVSLASMRFFNTNSSGRILNRFSKDMGIIDEIMPLSLLDTVQLGLAVVAIVSVVGAANPWLLIPTVLIAVLFYYLRIFYIATSRNIKRLEGMTRSPVFAHLGATLRGLTTIRAFGAGETLIYEFDRHQDLHSSAWYIYIVSARAFSFWLDSVSIIYIALVTLSFLALPISTTAASVGLAITQSIGLTGMFQWGLRQSTELENQMTSVERVLQYGDVEREPPLESAPDKKPKESWPETALVEFRGVSMRYSPTSPPVLKDLNFVVLPREKIGIVGRTGAGKSSMIAALFRLSELEGPIIIDGLDTRELGLHDLRSKLSIIPQEPFLFSGSFRRNLDPFDQYPDDLLWQVLEEVELKEMDLDAYVAEGGGNLSVGQRQLVCLARAILKNNPILVLDEATANVDQRTDMLIQKMIREKFSECTVLTIAHRLNTVMDSDRILVMDAGTVVEFDHPHVLLQDEGGYLYGMVLQTGRDMAKSLMYIAEQKFHDGTMTSL